MFIGSDSTDDQFRCNDGRCIMEKFLYLLFQTVQFRCDDGRCIINQFLCLSFQTVQKISFAVKTGDVS